MHVVLGMAFNSTAELKERKKGWFNVQRNIMEANSKTINIYEMNKDRMCF
jgi:hypothetical protein